MKKQTGYSLIELMISMLIGLIILSATVGIYVNTVGSSSNTLKSARLNYDVDSAMVLMVNDIRRSGYWSGAMPPGPLADNPFTAATTDVNTSTAGCILYTYDADADGVVDPEEYYGFKLNGSNIQMRFSGNTTTDCSQGNWENLNIANGSEQVNVTALTFTPSYKCLRRRQGVVDQDYNTTCATQIAANTIITGDQVVETREISIQLNGQVASDATSHKELSGQVKIANERMFRQP